MSPLYDIFNGSIAKKQLSGVVLPNSIVSNLKTGFGKRPYQIEAFKRYVYLDNEDEIDEKPKKPFHILYNMATGSGKTLVMAGLMLYLYEKGYRDFLFFVNSNNIINKTKDNFLNQSSSKYLFSDKIYINGNEVFIKEIESFENSDDININIKFTTIQQLHLDLNKIKENSISYEDFNNRKIVLIADESHHLVAGTRSGNLFGTWEDTVKKIHVSNVENVLLEFTATIDTETAELVNHYQDKVIFKYDLAQFRMDKYSKEINLVRSSYDETQRILQALILNLYRQELAAIYKINLKPVVLFKAKKTILESERNKENFHLLIENLISSYIDEIRISSVITVVKKAFDFFDSIGLTSYEIVRRLKSHFRKENCISANNDIEANTNQILLNTLEDENNPIRAVFAVNKLNEGWDVLNLFDIVRLYEGQNSGGSNKKIGSTTLSEAQLIGRGARYFPFAIQEGEDMYTRKYDNDFNNDLRILEELYYHTKEDSRYISELKAALQKSGLYDDPDDLVTKQLLLKHEFKQSNFYKTGKVVFNKRLVKSNDKVKSFEDFGISKHNFIFTLSSGIGKVSIAFQTEDENLLNKVSSIDIKVLDIPSNIVRFAVSQNPFFRFSNLVKFFPGVSSISNFINSPAYLGGLSITISGPASRLEDISNLDYLICLQKLLQNIESEVKLNTSDFEGSEFINDFIHNVFKDKDIRVNKNDPRADGQEEVVADAPWYVFNANYGTSEEKSFVSMFARRFGRIGKKFKNVYLIRNEREIKIFDYLGRAFEPDFILFCKEKEGQEFTYQVFIEPKGNHLKGYDKWKELFLNKIRDEKHVIKIHTDHYVITGLPFYNYSDENSFGQHLDSALLLTEN